MVAGRRRHCLSVR